jgi:hypothetical protein
LTNSLLNRGNGPELHVALDKDYVSQEEFHEMYSMASKAKSKIGVRQQGYKTLRESLMGIITAPFRRKAQRAKRKANPAKHSAPGALRSFSDAMLHAPCNHRQAMITFGPLITSP